MFCLLKFRCSTVVIPLQFTHSYLLIRHLFEFDIGNDLLHSGYKPMFKTDGMFVSDSSIVVPI